LTVARCCADAVGYLDGLLAGPLALVAKGAFLAALAAGCYTLATCPAGPLHAGSWKRLGLGLLLGNGLATLWASGRLYEAVRIPDSPFPSALAIPEWVAAEGALAFTDQGNAIQGLAGERPMPDDNLDARFGRFYHQRVIETAAKDQRYNCHGWVFTGGRFAVESEDVATILKDNDYQVVQQPSPGDVVVYRDERGAVVHTGLVRIASGDLVLVESKWGMLGRYLHKLWDQPYAQRFFEYYHSPRQGHLLASVSPREANDP
jgi:hypothetical protein